MTVTTSGDAGNLPMRAPKPVNVEWTLFHSLVVNFHVFLVLAAPLLILFYLLSRRENRSPDARRILRPALVCVIIWQAGLLVTGESASTYALMAPYPLTAVIIWLWSERLAKRPPWIGFIQVCAAAALTVFIIGVAAVLLAKRPERPLEMVAVGGLAVLLSLTAMLSARWMTRRSYTQARFHTWQFGWHILMPPFILLALNYGDRTVSAKEYVPQALAFGLIVALFHLCFLVFVSSNPLYRGRFHALLRLKDPRDSD